MKSEDKYWINKRYSERIKLENFSFEALRSGTPERREIRFKNLLDIGIKSGDKILDLGCGYGDFYSFLKSKNLTVDYTGYDINPDFIKESKKRNPKINFKVVDVINDNYPNFDWIVSTSCFNLILKEQNNYDFVKELFQSTFSHANKGVAIDFLTDYVEFKNELGFYYSPEKIFGIAKEITKCVTLKHDYHLFEFCIYMFPDFSGWKNIK